MFIFTTKLTRKKVIAAASVAVVLLCVLIVFAVRGGEEAVSTVNYKDIESNEDRVNFLESFGWKVSSEPIESQEVRIPTEFNEVYEKYNELQKSQGFDLSKYAGKKIKRYTYEVTNYPGTADEVLVTLLVYKNTVIGGDIMSTSLDGFIHGLMPEASISNPTQNEDAQTGLSDVEFETVMDDHEEELAAMNPDSEDAAKEN